MAYSPNAIVLGENQHRKNGRPRLNRAGDNIDIDGFLAENGYPDQAMDAARVRSLVWELAQKIMQESRPGAMTIADLSQTLTQSATHALGISEDELIRILKNHIPH